MASTTAETAFTRASSDNSEYAYIILMGILILKINDGREISDPRRDKDFLFG